MTTALLALLLAAQAPAADGPETIVVEGRRLEEALEACLARQCPPGEEIEAYLGVAVARFADGEIVSAKRLLERAIRRNRRHAEVEPGRVASLYATFAALSDYEGDAADLRNGSLQSMRVLRDHGGGPATLAAIDSQITVGDMFARIGHHHSAMAAYRRAGESAVAIGQPRIAAMTLFQQAGLAMARRDFGGARRLADEAIAIGPAGDAQLTRLREVLLARIDAAKGDDDALDTALARPGEAGARPMLIDALSYAEAGAVYETTITDEGITWMDVGFWIRPDGSTGGAEVMRGNGDESWVRRVLRQIASRRYGGMPGDAAEPGLYRIERFTLRRSYGPATGTILRTRGGAMELLVSDLTNLDNPAPPSG